VPAVPYFGVQHVGVTTIAEYCHLEDALTSLQLTGLAPCRSVTNALHPAEHGDIGRRGPPNSLGLQCFSLAWIATYCAIRDGRRR
jgi:hypothetical protein